MDTPPSLPSESRILNQRPYAPSWADALTAWIDRRPGQNWVYYVGCWTLLIVIDLVLRWSEGNSMLLPRPFVLVFLIAFPYNLFLIDYLDKAAAAALMRFRPGLNCDDDSFDTMRYHLTTMREGPALLSVIAAMAIGVIILSIVPLEQQLRFVGVDRVGKLFYFHVIMAQAAFIAATLIVYHTWHQLRVVNYIYRKYTVVNLFNQQPLYAFSTLTAQTAVGILFISYSWTLAAPELFEIPATSIWLPIFNVICALTFIYPLIGIHNLLRADKEMRLGEVGKRMTTAINELHRRIGENQLVDMDNLDKVFQSLEVEYDAIKRAPTWPWHPEAPRAVAAALVLPMFLWLMQLMLSRMVTP
jgi:hypothetical protein